ncbi:MAG TPA: phosphatidate cytidylyltransferase [Solirubrobacteraceae bacterium]|nr:phosphatidate cytidylyltransferase [Solirubrobacteraceae bacterium]
MTVAPPPPRSGPPPTRGGGGSASRKRSDLGPRLLAAIPAIVFAIVIVTWGGGVFLAGAVALGLVCLHELYTMAAEAEPVRLGGFLGLIGLGCAAFFGDATHVLLALVATIPLVFAVGLVQARPPGMAGIAVTLLGLTWVGLAIAHAVLLRELEHGGGVIVSILVGTFAGDTGAYVGGRGFGRTLLAPSISPNKTREGLVVGMATAVVFVWLAGLYQDWMSGTQALLLGLAVATAAPVGDIFESWIKRDLGAKDTGRLFGAHGGALDRLDAAFFTLVVGYYVWSAVV